MCFSKLLSTQIVRNFKCEYANSTHPKNMSTQIVRKFKKGFLPSGIWRGLHVVFEEVFRGFSEAHLGND